MYIYIDVDDVHYVILLQRDQPRMRGDLAAIEDKFNGVIRG